MRINSNFHHPTLKECVETFFLAQGALDLD